MKSTYAYDPMTERTSEQSDATLITYITQQLVDKGMLSIDKKTVRKLIKSIATSDASEAFDEMISRSR